MSKQDSEERQMIGEPVQDITIPCSGRKVRARRLSPMCILMTTERRSQLHGSEQMEDLVEDAHIVLSTIQEVLIEPTLSLKPGAGQLHPNKLSKEESGYLYLWGMGLVSADGTNLAQAFREKRADVPAVGANGGGLRDAAEQLRRDLERGNSAEV